MSIRAIAAAVAAAGLLSASAGCGPPLTTIITTLVKRVATVKS